MGWVREIMRLNLIGLGLPQSASAWSSWAGSSRLGRATTASEPKSRSECLAANKKEAGKMTVESNQGEREAITVLIADDHAIVRQGLRTYLDLQPDMRVVAEAADGQQAIEGVRNLLPDVVLMDLVMPVMD